ncbi:hypothetical protein BZG35_09535 [Brevundimonas sp. LM2]|uniref:hypothetical protein n=1 Tax=Brevundimonas sp. LM2 TaxID=1938605 RepID=UPI000983CD67|nr:hypothetical protein [Brevundimonas sp. LM2]AQR61865.1 hypothetical protein BZG35_09535 [Brevundimonas sp. LM2]
MSRPSKGNFSAWLRGGQNIGHTFDMIREVLARIVIVLILWRVVSVVCVLLRVSEEEQTHGTQCFMAGLFEWVGPPSPPTISLPTPGYGPRPYPVSKVSTCPSVFLYAAAYRTHAMLGPGLWLRAGFLLVGLISTRGFPTPNHPDNPAGQLASQDDKPGIEISDDMEIQ